jgi:hypothetical protein
MNGDTPYIAMQEELGRKRRGTPPLLCWDVYMQSHFRKLQLLDDVVQLAVIAAGAKWDRMFPFEERLLKAQQAILVTDPQMKIVFASSNTCEHSGCHTQDLVGTKPGFLKAENCSTAETVMQSVREQQPFDLAVSCCHQYTKAYRCRVEGYPVRNRKRELIHFIIFQHTIRIQ